MYYMRMETVLMVGCLLGVVVSTIITSNRLLKSNLDTLGLVFHLSTTVCLLMTSQILLSLLLCSK